MPSCSCGKASVYLARYAGESFCAEHFCEFVERRVRREMRQQGPFKRGRIAVAVSGGKDSIVTLRLLHETFGSNPALELSAVTIDEGIATYRPPSVVVAAKHCAEIGVPHTILSYEETAGVTMDKVVAHPNRTLLPCAYCGVMRRRNLNEAARRAGASHLATGHNLDDIAQTILMNHLKGDVERLARMGPHRPEHVAAVAPGNASEPAGSSSGGLIPRIFPLRLIPEREVALYAILRGWSYHDGECPYAADATRGRYRDLLLQLEDESPGTRHALIAGYDRLAPMLVKAKSVRACATCGEPSSGERCRACALIESVGGDLDQPRRA